KTSPCAIPMSFCARVSLRIFNVAVLTLIGLANSRVSGASVIAAPSRSHGAGQIFIALSQCAFFKRLDRLNINLKLNITLHYGSDRGRGKCRQLGREHCWQTRLPHLPGDEEPDDDEIGQVEQSARGKGRRVEAEVVVERAGKPAAKGHPRHAD